MEVPGGIYLCQVSDTVSCGACCGLYNVSDPSYESLSGRLLTRSEIFSSTPRDTDSIEAFAQEIISMEPKDRPLPHFHHCPFVGFTGPERRSIGCLLHPMAPGNNGIDYRGLSHYGGMACKICFCPAHQILAASYREVLRRTAPDWHTFGILISECRTLELFFREVEARAPDFFVPGQFYRSKQRLQATQAVYMLMVNWPFREREFPLGTYFLGERGLQKSPLDYDRLDSPASRYDPLFLELASDFQTRKELDQAEQSLDELFNLVAEAGQ